MKYRQRSNKDTGAKKFNTQFIFKGIKELQEINFDKHIAQATAFFQRRILLKHKLYFDRYK